MNIIRILRAQGFKIKFTTRAITLLVCFSLPNAYNMCRPYTCMTRAPKIFQ